DGVRAGAEPADRAADGRSSRLSGHPTKPLRTERSALSRGPHMTATLAHTHNGRTGTPPERFTSHNADDFAVPTGREEDWRFTPVRKLRELFVPFEPTTRITGDVRAPDGVTWSIDALTPAQVLVPADRVSALALSGAP